MNIASLQFTPWASLAGGLVIGLATALCLLGSGRIAGIAANLASPLRALLAGTRLRPEANRLWFLAGLLAAPWAW